MAILNQRKKRADPFDRSFTLYDGAISLYWANNKKSRIRYDSVTCCCRFRHGRYLASQRSAVERNIAAVKTPVAKRNRVLERDKAKAEFAQRRTEWENKHLGGYKRIYPTADGGAKYSHLFEAAKEIWSNATGVTRTRPLLQSLQQARGAVSDEAQNTELPGLPKPLSPLTRSGECSDVLMKSKNERTKGNSSWAAGITSSSFVSSRLNRLQSTQRAQSLAEGKISTITSRQTLFTTDPLPILPSGNASAYAASRSFSRQLEEASQRPLASQLPAFLDNQCYSAVHDTKPVPTASLELCNKEDIPVSQASTEASSEARDATSNISLDRWGSQVCLRSESLGWSSVLSTSSLLRTESMKHHPHGLIRRDEQMCTQQLRSKQWVSRSRGHAPTPRCRGRPKGPPLQLPRVDLSLAIQPVSIKRPLRSRGASSSTHAAKATPPFLLSGSGAASG